MRRAISAAVIVAGAAAAGLVLAQSGPATRPTLHEPLPLVNAEPGKSSAIIRREGGSGAPTAMVAGDKVLPMPDLSAAKRSDEPVLGAGQTPPGGGQAGQGMDRMTEWKPRLDTGPDNTLHYASVFNPDVLPFKRMTVFDAVGDDYTMHVGRGILTEIPTTGAHDERTHDRFWGDLRVELHPGVDVPIPSVAPDMRILWHKVEPALQLHFLKDGADNFYIRTDDKRASGTYHLVFQADADARYFAPALPTGQRYRVEDVTRRAPPEYIPAIPPRILEQARQTLAKDRIAVDSKTPLDIAFNKLVGYFRAFEAGEVRNPTGDVYRDLCDSQAGVCRHRSFAFFITANALGIPTRYVQNEAHAFVEVWFPERGWQRIDLGGAALRMEVTGASDKELHRPRGTDPFVKPPEYQNGQYTNLEGDVRGLTQKQIADKRKSLDDAPASGAVATGPHKLDDIASGSGSGSGSEADDDSPFGTDRITPDPTAPLKRQDPRKPTPELLVTTADTSAFRGDGLHVEGTARANGKGIANHRVDVFLSPAGMGGQGAIAIGYGVTGADGTFKVDLTVPPNLSLERYEIRLSTSDDAYYNPALSD
jgi:hypothetical protein